jgi:hypothetical protein
VSSIDDAFARHKAAEAAQAEEVQAPQPKFITGRFEIFVPSDEHPEIERMLLDIEGIDDLFMADVTQSTTDDERKFTIYSFDVEDAFELGPTIHSVVIKIGELLGVDDIYCTWHAVTGVRW